MLTFFLNFFSLIILHYIMLCYVMLYFISFHFISFIFIFFYFILFYFVSYYFILFHFIGVCVCVCWWGEFEMKRIVPFSLMVAIYHRHLHFYVYHFPFDCN